MSELNKFRAIFSSLKMTKKHAITVPIIFVDGKHLSNGYEQLKKYLIIKKLSKLPLLSKKHMSKKGNSLTKHSGCG
jgi:hypothetical protein